jgi:peptidoglycan/xylan/chitin deacetylase (PgdA/CDA1 family)
MERGTSKVISQEKNVELSHGGIIRGDSRVKQITLVFTGHDLAEGYPVVSKVLKAHGIKASFFLTGDFYRNSSFSGIISQLRKDGHYLGAHSDRHLLYCDWTNRDSLLVSKGQFINDLKNNYAAMVRVGIDPLESTYFLPPFEWYNDSIADWCKQYGLTLVNFTPGTSANQDWTYPSLGDQYVSSDVIYKRILDHEKSAPAGLNGFILLTHFGADVRRPDKFYRRLDDLITLLKRRGYDFVTLRQMLE